MVFSCRCHSLYSRALRRRYGIPDDDERPFPIAYRAARARMDEGSEDGSCEAVEQLEDGHLPLPPHRVHPDAPMLVRRRKDGEDVAGMSCSFFWLCLYSQRLLTASHEPEVPRSATHAPYVSQYDPTQVVYNAWQNG